MPPCIVKVCKNNSDTSVLGISYHTFSKQLWKEWLRTLKLLPHEVYKNSIICSEHFKPSDFITWNQYKTYRRLQRHAIPSLNLNQAPANMESIEVKKELVDYSEFNEITICDKELNVDSSLQVDKFEAEDTTVNDLVSVDDAVDSSYKILDEFVNSELLKHINDEPTSNFNVNLNDFPCSIDGRKSNESVDSNYVDIPDAIMIEGEIPGKTAIDSNNFRIVNINKLLKNPGVDNGLINLNKLIKNPGGDKTDCDKEVNKQEVINALPNGSVSLRKDLVGSSLVKKKCGDETRKIVPGTVIIKRRKMKGRKVEGKKVCEDKSVSSVQQKQFKDYLVGKHVFPQIVQIEELKTCKLSQYKGVQLHNKRLKIQAAKTTNLNSTGKSISVQKSKVAIEKSVSLPEESIEVQTKKIKKILHEQAKNCDNFDPPDKSLLKQALLQMAKTLDKGSESDELNLPKSNCNKNNKSCNPAVASKEIWLQPARKKAPNSSINVVTEPSNHQNLKGDPIKQMEILKEIAIHHNYCLNPENLASEIQGLKQRLKVKENMCKIITNIQTQVVGEVKDLSSALKILEAKYDEWIDCFL